MGLWFSCWRCGADVADFNESDKYAICEVCGTENEIPRIPVNPFRRVKFRSMVLWYLLYSIALSLLGLALEALNLDLVMDYLSFFAFHILILVWLRWKFRKLNVNFRQLVGSAPSNLRWLPVIAYVIPLMIFSVGAGKITYYISSILSPSFAKEWFAGEELSILHVLFLVIVVPPAEELFFRGFLINRWTVKWDISKAVLFSTIVFAILHKNVIGALAYGFVLAIIYIKSQTLVTSIICHVLINGSALGMAIIGSIFSSSKAVRIFGGLLNSKPWFGLLCFAISAPWVIYFIRNNWPDRNTGAPYFRSKYSK